MGFSVFAAVWNAVPICVFVAAAATSFIPDRRLGDVAAAAAAVSERLQINEQKCPLLTTE